VGFEPRGRKSGTVPLGHRVTRPQRTFSVLYCKKILTHSKFTTPESGGPASDHDNKKLNTDVSNVIKSVAEELHDSCTLHQRS